MSLVQQRLEQHGFQLPAAPPSIGDYLPVRRFGNSLITSGQLPYVGQELAFVGRVGADITEEEAQHAARLCVLNGLAQIQAFLGDLDQVVQVLRLDGFVRSAEGFSRQPAVLNAASALLTKAFGDAGRHTRVAIGVSELPLGAAVELALWVEVAPPA